MPGTVKGLDHALTHYGRFDRARVMAPAIALARDGFVLGEPDIAILDGKAAKLAGDTGAAKIFLRPDGSRFQPGDRLVQSDLAATLAAVAERGPDAFYRGPIATSVAAASARGNGLLTAADFADYTVRERNPDRLHLSRLSDPLGAPAQFGRDDPVRDAQRDRRLGYRSARA